MQNHRNPLQRSIVHRWKIGYVQSCQAAIQYMLGCQICWQSLHRSMQKSQISFLSSGNSSCSYRFMHGVGLSEAFVQPSLDPKPPKFPLDWRARREMSLGRKEELCAAEIEVYCWLAACRPDWVAAWAFHCMLGGVSRASNFGTPKSASSALLYLCSVTCMTWIFTFESINPQIPQTHPK